MDMGERQLSQELLENELRRKKDYIEVLAARLHTITQNLYALGFRINEDLSIENECYIPEAKNDE